MNDAQDEDLAKFAEAWRKAYQYPTILALVDIIYDPSKGDKLRENYEKLEDCRKRRMSAILRISRMMQI